LIFSFASDFVYYFQLFTKLQATKQEILDLQEEHIKERQSLATNFDELNQAIKLK